MQVCEGWRAASGFRLGRKATESANGGREREGERGEGEKF